MYVVVEAPNRWNFSLGAIIGPFGEKGDAEDWLEQNGYYRYQQLDGSIDWFSDKQDKRMVEIRFLHSPH